jgi:hypothetical protein
MQASGKAVERPLLLIPGPVEMNEDVLRAAATIGTSHVDPLFVKTFGAALKNLKHAFLAPDGFVFFFFFFVLFFFFFFFFCAFLQFSVCCYRIWFSGLGHVWS